MNAPSLPRLLVSQWQPSWSVVLPAAATAGLYVWALRRLRWRWPAARSASFVVGIACVVVALQSGIGAFDDRLLTVHMVQHMMLLLVAPLLLLLGQPVLLALRAVPREHRAALGRVLQRFRRFARPLFCLSAFYAVLLLTHLPWFYDTSVTNQPLHDAEHVLFVIAGLLLWWPIADVDPAPARRLGALGRLVYLLAAMPPMALIGSYLNRHTTLVYAAYGPPGHALGISPVADQQRAGALMWVAGNSIMIAVGLWAVIAALVAEERRQQAREARAAGAAGGSGALR